MADQPPPRPMALDPPHITEFGSKAFHEKLAQGSSQQHNQQQHSVDASTAGPSTFSLPVRETKTTDFEVPKPSDQKRDKSRFRLRSKVSFLHSRPSHAEAATPPPLPAEPFIVEQRRPSAVSTHSTLQFDQIVLRLPNELQTHILCSLPLNDILNLRLASKSWHALISLHEVQIARYHLKESIPAFANRLYPLEDPAQATLHHVCGLWHRLHVASKLAYLIAEYVTKDIYLRRTAHERLGFAPQHELMRRRLIPLLFTLFHFFETYRKLQLQHIAEYGGHGVQFKPYTLNPIEVKIMSMYDDKTLFRVHQVWPLVVSSFCRRLRPPTYVGRVERSLRGYIRDKPSDPLYSAILCIGGLRQVLRLWEEKGYNKRRGSVDDWYYSLLKKDDSAPEPTIPTKSRRGLFSRKKSAAGEPSRLGEGSSRRPSAADDITSFDKLVFNTSLAAGAPMPPLHWQQNSVLLDDLPVLQEIWCRTAEALLYQRQVVRHPSQIPKNDQVLLHLVREGAWDDQDQWLYGQARPDSVRPFLEDDAD